jgi:hypothetical protein
MGLHQTRSIADYLRLVIGGAYPVTESALLVRLDRIVKT